VPNCPVFHEGPKQLDGHQTAEEDDHFPVAEEHVGEVAGFFQVFFDLSQVLDDT
jgi:hypothetical protein